jgi:hypothetical protein
MKLISASEVFPKGEYAEVTPTQRAETASNQQDRLAALWITAGGEA